MDTATVTSLIGTVGFPIVMCLLLWHRMEKQDEQHKEEMNNITAALNNNTQALTELSTKLELGASEGSKK